MHEYWIHASYIHALCIQASWVHISCVHASWIHASWIHASWIHVSWIHASMKHLSKIHVSEGGVGQLCVGEGRSQEGPKGLHLEVGARRAPRPPVKHNFNSTYSIRFWRHRSRILHIFFWLTQWHIFLSLIWMSSLLFEVIIPPVHSLNVSNFEMSNWLKSQALIQKEKSIQNTQYYTLFSLLTKLATIAPLLMRWEIPSPETDLFGKSSHNVWYCNRILWGWAKIEILTWL